METLKRITSFLKAFNEIVSPIISAAVLILCLYIWIYKVELGKDPKADAIFSLLLLIGYQLLVIRLRNDSDKE